MTGTKPGRFPLVDSLRAIAAFSVFAYHLRGYTPMPGIVRYGDAGVVIFFVISAFLLYRPFARAHIQGTPPPAVGEYLRRRVLRIVPAYWVALTAAAVILADRAILGPHGPLFYGFGQIYRRDTVLSGLGPAWTLCIEATLYAFLPLWAWTLRSVPLKTPGGRAAAQLAGVVLLIAVSTAFKLATLDVSVSLKDFTAFTLDRSLLRYLDFFALGIALAVVSVRWEGRRLPAPLRPLDRFPGISWAIAAAALWGATVVAPQHPVEVGTATFMVRYWLFGAIGVFLLLPTIFGDQERGLLRRVLAVRWLVWCGTVSYAVYLWHTIVLRRLSGWGTPNDLALDLRVATYWVWIPMAVGITLAIAALSWRFVEAPILRLKGRPLRGLYVPDVLDSPAGRAGSGVIGAIVILLGVSGVGYAVCDIALVGAGVALLAVAAPWRRLRVPLTATPFAAVLAAVAVVVPLLVAPGPASGTPATPTPAGAAKGAPATKATRSVAHLVLTFSGKQLTLYVDGKQSATKAASGPTDPGANITEIGAFLGTRPWNGAIDELSFYNRALPAAAVAAHYKAGSGKGGYTKAVRATAGLVGYWHLTGTNKLGDVAGAATSKRSKNGVVNWPPLTGGSKDGAIALNGYDGVIQVRGVPRARKAFSVETWVLGGPSVSNRTIVARAGAWFVKTDVYSRWTGGFFKGRKITAVSSKQGAGISTDAKGKPVAAPASGTSGGSDGDGVSPVVLVIILMAVAALVAASLPLRRLKDPPADGEDPPADDPA